MGTGRRFVQVDAIWIHAPNRWIVPVLAAWLTPVIGSAQQFTYASSALPANSVWTNGVQVADVDADGDDDLAFANGSFYGGTGTQGAQPQHLYLNGGTGAFTAAHAQLNVANFNAHMVVAVDADQDGDLDLAYASGSTGSPPRLLINGGAGVFSDQTSTRVPPLALRSFCIAAGDVDDDGDADLAVNDGGTFGGTAAQSRLLRNNGQGVYADVTATQVPADLYNSQDITLIDFDGDYDLDYAQSGKGGSGKQGRLWLNDGTGHFSIDSAMNAVGTNGTYEIDWADVDGDKDLDALVLSVAGFLDGVAYNQGPGSRMTPQNFPSPGGSDDNELVGLDYDNDGDIDVLIGSLSSQERLYRNDGPLVWTNVNSAIQSLLDSTLDVGIGDFNGDQRYDFATAQGESGNFTDKVYFNNGPTDTRPPAFLGTEAPALGPGATRFHCTVQDAIQDDGQAGHYAVAYSYLIQSGSGTNSGSGTAYHLGGGTWSAVIPTPVGATGACVTWTATDEAGNMSTSSAAVGSGPRPEAGGFLRYGSGCAGSSGIVPTLDVAGSLAPGGSLEIDIARGLGGSKAYLALGLAQASVPLLGCDLLVAPLITIVPMPGVLGGAAGTPGVGWAHASFAFSAGPVPALALQAFVLDFSAPNGLLSATNGVQVDPQALQAPRASDLYQSTGTAHLSLPAGFFGAGSPAFAGDAVLQGAPVETLGPYELGTTSVVIDRRGFVWLPVVGSQQLQVPIELVQLSLVSIQPITVSPGNQWNLRVELGPEHASQAGTGDYLRTSFSGGSLSVQLPCRPRFRFTQGAQEILYDPSELTLTGSGTFGGLSSCPACALTVAQLGAGYCHALQLASALLDLNLVPALVTSHPPASIDPSAQIDPQVGGIGRLAVIGAGAVIGEGAIIGPHAVIGANTVVGPLAVVGDHADIGAGCTLSAGAVVDSRARLDGPNAIAYRAVVGTDAHLSPAASLGAYAYTAELYTAGASAALGAFVEAGAAVQVGAGAIVTDGLVLASGAVVPSFTTLLGSLLPCQVGTSAPFATSKSVCEQQGGVILGQLTAFSLVQQAPGNQVSVAPIDPAALPAALANLCNDVNAANVAPPANGGGGQPYVPVTHDCDDFADELEQALQALGYDATFTVIFDIDKTKGWWQVWKPTLINGHGLVDVHSGGNTIWIEAQRVWTGAAVNLDNDGDGMVEYTTSKGSDATDGCKHIEVYDDLAAAEAAGWDMD